MVPTTEVAPVAEVKLEAAHEPAVPLLFEPQPSPKFKRTPTPFVVNHVPAVGPATVTVLYSQVFAAVMENVNGYE